MRKKTRPKPCGEPGCDAEYDKPDCRLERAIKALRQVSFYARINHGDKSKDYGEVVDPVLKLLGETTGEL